MKELEKIFSRLGMNDQNGLFLTSENTWKGRLPARVERLLEDKLKPEAFFCIDNKPIVLFYNFPKNKKELFKAIWNFNKSPVIIVNEPDTIEILNGLSYLKNEMTLEKLEDNGRLDHFSYFELVTGKTWQTYENKLKYQNRVDYKLLENIKTARDLLIDKYKDSIDSSLSNAIIGKCIFIRYLIDRKVSIDFDGTLRQWSNEEFCNLLKNKGQTIQFLNYLKGRFNGEAFLLEDSHLNNIPQGAFDILRKLMQGTDIATGQMSLFDIYDFSIIPVEFISNVYEYFIGSKNQAKKGAYYTPLFLVDYIVKETVEKYFETNTEKYSCKILDPACGSGIFLVEALRRIIERYQKIASAKTKSFKDILRKIAEENIYGIDQDKNAINVAIFSVYLALLDYQEPKEIANFKFPKLINKNFFTSDFFDLDADFNNIIDKINFDFILGNPPWKRGSDRNALFLKYIEKRKKKESSQSDRKPLPTVSNNEIAQAFLLRTSNFSNIQTKCALIVTSKILYNLNAKDFRRYFLHNYFIDKVFELAPVRKEVFDRSNDPSVAPAAILFFHYAHGKVTDKNIIEHIALKPNRFFSLFKVFMLQRNDYKQVVQSRLIEYDWLWKTLVYGSYMDFNFIKRVKEDYTTIEKTINNKNRFLVKQGFKLKDGYKKINVEQLIGWDFLDKNKKELKQFHITPLHEEWKISTVGYIYKKNNSIVLDVFTPPFLLVSDAVNNKYQSITALSLSKLVFTDQTTSIKAYSKKDINCLRILSGLLNLNLFSYYILHAGSNIGIERERVHDKEKFSFPYLNNSTIAEYVEKIEAISKKLYKEKQKPLNPVIQTLEDEKKKLINDLDDEILNSFNLNEQERALVDYAVNIIIPLIMKHKGYWKELFSPLKIKDPFLTKYAEIFLNRFRDSFKRHNKTFIIQVLCSNHIIGMFFKVPDKKNNQEQISWEDKSENDLLLKLASLGCQEITKSLFIQKDIRGFERDGFYISKPK